LKHKRQEFSIDELVGTLDVGDKARAKDVKGKMVGEGSSSAHVVQATGKRNSSKNLSKNPPLLSRMVRSRTRRKKIISPVVSLGTMQESALMLSGSHLLQ
jgi:hypothetical protein